MNTALSGSGRVDSADALPSGELRGLTKLIRITEDVRKYAAEQSLTEEKAVKRGYEEKSVEFAAKGAELYARL